LRSGSISTASDNEGRTPNYEVRESDNPCSSEMTIRHLPCRNLLTCLKHFAREPLCTKGSAMIQCQFWLVQLCRKDTITAHVLYVWVELYTTSRSFSAMSWVSEFVDEGLRRGIWGLLKRLIRHRSKCIYNIHIQVKPAHISEGHRNLVGAREGFARKDKADPVPESKVRLYRVLK
jgi:hypothetical protein